MRPVERCIRMIATKKLETEFSAIESIIHRTRFADTWQRIEKPTLQAYLDAGYFDSDKSHLASNMPWTKYSVRHQFNSMFGRRGEFLNAVCHEGVQGVTIRDAESYHEQHVDKIDATITKPEWHHCYTMQVKTPRMENDQFRIYWDWVRGIADRLVIANPKTNSVYGFSMLQVKSVLVDYYNQHVPDDESIDIADINAKDERGVYILDSDIPVMTTTLEELYSLIRPIEAYSRYKLNLSDVAKMA